MAAAIDHLSIYGPAGFQPQEICRELGISKALVNYHFGTREGLVAAAIVVAYEQHADRLVAAATDAGPGAVDRLMAWIDHMIEWTTTHSGLAAAIMFPQAALGRGSLEAELDARMRTVAVHSFEHLRGLVRDARTELVGAEVVDDDDVNRNTTAVIGFLALGASVWIGGNPLPTRQTQATNLPPARAHMRTTITEMLART